MPNYDRVLEAFQVRGCQLLSTKEEVEQNFDEFPKYRYIAKCSHEHVVFYNVFAGKRATGHICPSCVNKESVKKGYQLLRKYLDIIVVFLILQK